MKYAPAFLYFISWVYVVLMFVLLALVLLWIKMHGRKSIRFTVTNRLFIALYLAFLVLAIVNIYLYNT